MIIMVSSKLYYALSKKDRTKGIPTIIIIII